MTSKKRDLYNLTRKEYQDFNNPLMEAAEVSLPMDDEKLFITQRRVKAKFDKAIRGLNKIAE